MILVTSNETFSKSYENSDVKQIGYIWKFYIHQPINLFVLESTKIYIKIHTKMILHVSFCDHHKGVRTWAWLKLQLLKMFCKNTSLWTCSGVAAYYVILHSKLPHYCMPITTYFYRTLLTIVILARLNYKLPDDGHRTKHVGAFYYEF
jgi:hypothetical protein